MPATPEDVRARIAAAARVAREAATAAEQESRAALDRLRARPAAERFAALEDGAPQLLPEHRRELLRSVREPAGKVEPLVRPTALHASAFAVWRGRLPFQARRLTRDALLALCLVSAIGLAYHRTPTSWVEVRSDRDVAATWVMPNGQPGGDRLVAGRAYAQMRVIGEETELRDWRPGEGYAVTRVPTNWLRTRAALR
ncbi:hypothetical protein LNAOJCKE_4624 [Methylorubrum aminovorans]|uniref:Uncharacterized protein n=2 Tax=Methylorubrum TaxID=2282523 RepID=A0ABU9ZKE7_9HYPH|nr:hypothetical protein [Methylorubrum aminovorans]GJE67393.1 hypothetical protein LNAOJCKE_4624 [Methylorubrum aminovorans]GMA80200.1 hypothetical protein GCM10025880_66170 [Methylorubrum aminovorans]